MISLLLSIGHTHVCFYFFEVEGLVGLKTIKAFRLLKELCDEGQLTQQVSGKFTRYIPSTM